MSESFEHHHDLSTPPTAVRWDLGEKPSVEQSQEKICAVRLGLRVLGIAECYVRGLRHIEAVTPVPLTPAHVLGVTAVDGSIVPLVDVAAALGERPFAGEGPFTALLVEADASTVLIAIDEVVAFEKKGEAADQEAADGQGVPWTAGMAPIQGRPITLLDLPGLLRSLRPEPAGATMKVPL